jgi:hypothetical protein
VIPHSVCATCGFYKGRKVLVTKLDRALKRGETRRDLAQKQQAMHAAEGQNAQSE